MTNKKISALSSASTPLTGSEIVPINQSSVTDSVSVANLTAGRSVSASDYVMSTGNLVPVFWFILIPSVAIKSHVFNFSTCFFQSSKDLK